MVNISVDEYKQNNQWVDNSWAHTWANIGKNSRLNFWHILP